NKIEKVPANVLEGLYQELSSSANNPRRERNGTLIISLKQNIRIQRDMLSTPLINFLKEELNFANTEFFIKKKSGKSTFGTERYFKLIEENKNEILIPRGFIRKLLRFCNEQNVELDF